MVSKDTVFVFSLDEALDVEVDVEIVVEVQRSSGVSSSTELEGQVGHSDTSGIETQPGVHEAVGTGSSGTTTVYCVSHFGIEGVGEAITSSNELLIAVIIGSNL